MAHTMDEYLLWLYQAISLRGVRRKGPVWRPHWSYVAHTKRDQPSRVEVLRSPYFYVAVIPLGRNFGISTGYGCILGDSEREEISDAKKSSSPEHSPDTSPVMRLSGSCCST